MKNLLTILLLLFCSPAWGAVTTLYPTADTKLNPSSVDTNYDTSTVCTSYLVDTACIFKFDLTGYNSAQVISAEFRVYIGGRSFQHNAVVSRLLRDFTSNQSTWNIYSAGNNWGTAGATNSTTDYTTTNQQINAVPNGGWFIIDATDLVKDMIDNSTPQLIFRAVNANFSSNSGLRMVEYPGTEYDPQLIIRTGVPGQSTTWHVRTDGGTCGLGNQCDGTTDAAYDGDGTNEACACALPSYLNNIMQGEDIAIVHSGSYDTTQINIPSGTSPTLRTQFYGEGWDTGCSDPPELWTSTTASSMINLNGISNVDIQCLEITDHTTTAGATLSENKLLNGIQASDSENVYIKNVNIHGGYRGVHAGRLTNWDIENVKLNMNRSAGWNGDITGDDSNSGTINFTNVEITYNGCAEDYETGLPTFCCSQAQGCYGDGLGTGSTAGIWNFTGCNISHNTSDGLDLLYSTSETEVNVYRSLMEGNAGNQLKIPNNSHVENSLIIGNCGYFYGQSFTATTHISTGVPTAFDNCRAGGNTIELAFSSDTEPEIFNNTILGNGDVLVDTTGMCSSGTDVFLSNNIMLGGRQRNDDTYYNAAGGNDSVSVYYDADGDTCDTDRIETYNICYGFKEGTDSCNGTGSTDTVDPGFTGVILMGPAPSPGYYTDDDYWTQLYISAATGAADETAGVVNSNDYNNYDRGAAWDIGALEYGSNPPAPSCQTDCSQCDSSGTCAASAYGCYWWLNSTCQTTEDPCNAACTSCSEQSDCEASTSTCYWWTTNQCQATEEELPGNCNTDCTVCSGQTACEASTFGCYYQFDGSCKSTEDPCNTYCGNCDASTCGLSEVGCYMHWDDRCRSYIEGCSNHTNASACESGLPGCFWDATTCTASQIHSRGVIEIQGGVTFK